ncbi:nitrite/sulfite reductase [Sphingobacterium chuzhouense]|uniref:Nitrite/sulfite reductase n=1 Tax=Sphingobacterium chuzhouense TaxID=1742264 RepID=A0ABR7XT07_9SPHI|nr:nitrite/sulfite reductase [Sphingobacterium chuzhouense]MBD1422310.1 nitrite/sulfite reductase [Sphingobacterium chuzhouense]
MDTIFIGKNVDHLARRDIVELDDKIRRYQKGEFNEESFRAFRLTRGIYGQRQDGVNMIRIKLPFGRLSPMQLRTIAELSEKYASGNLHATTRQDIQLHYVKLVDTPQLWADLENDGITLREACGNTIRNLTASPYAGIDPDELFDVSPYANAMFKYFLRNPICQNLGRKFKIAFSSSSSDSAYTFMHDLGFIPRIIVVDGEEKRGFKIMLAGGLGAQPFIAHPIFDFMPDSEIIPFTEACLRIFDRYGERAKRHKARLKYLINDIGVEKFLELVHQEREAVSLKSYVVDLNDFEETAVPNIITKEEVVEVDQERYERWLLLNTYRQKQQGYFAVRVKLRSGNMNAYQARALSTIAEKYASSDIRITVNQGVLLKYVRPQFLKMLFVELENNGLSDFGFDTLTDITACPGTDTCNLGIASSVGLSVELERLLRSEYGHVDYMHHIKVKISGCMNGCAHHSIANIGFHGMSMKVKGLILPAMQVVLGGGPTDNGTGTMGEKVIKLPAKCVPDALRLLLNDYADNRIEEESFNTYFVRIGKTYFYNLLKPLGDIDEVTQFHLTDWGNESIYTPKIGIGECAVPMIDMVGVVLEEVKETLNKAKEAIFEEQWVDAIYYSYTGMINTGKALLLTKEVPCNTQLSVINNMDPNFIENGEIKLSGTFADLVLQINKEKASKVFADSYYGHALSLFHKAIDYRNLN